VDYSDSQTCRVTFDLPAIHCIACVWLLENLYRFHAGIGRSLVNFLRREVAITFDPGRITLGRLAQLLASLGYAPRLSLADLEPRQTHPAPKRLYLQVGVAGFAFGNIMLFSFASYLGMGAADRQGLRGLFGGLSLLLALPVLVYSGADYWRAAVHCWRQRRLTIEAPIAIGLLALFAQSAYDILSGRGEGYLDSLAGLVFFLLCGKVFQRKVFDRVVFDHDYRRFFPLSVVRSSGNREETVPISRLRVGDRLVLRNRELIPADARLVSGRAFIDYSFVTGESEPVAKGPGDYLYAGGHQVGGAIEVEMVKPVSQSYLTSLWGDEAFTKKGEDRLPTLTDRFSRRFTVAVLVVACATGLYWAAFEPSMAARAFTAVLIVACPCALALAAPFALGTGQRWLAGANVFLKNSLVLERLARVDAVVLDKTGTLTTAGAQGVSFEGGVLSTVEQSWVYSLTRHSTHPYSVRLGEALGAGQFPEPVESWQEVPGWGLAGRVQGHAIRLGSRDWLAAEGISVPAKPNPGGGAVFVAIDGEYRGCHVLANQLRPNLGGLLAELAPRYELALLSGDNEKERERLRPLFGEETPLHFHQSPLDKLAFVRRLQRSGRTVLMVGDGLNDAGALKQSDVGVAVVEAAGAFSPASDVILSGEMVPRLGAILRFARGAAGVVRLSFLLSSVYNVVGISVAACGLLSPAVCAVLMPLSSASVVSFACGATAWVGRRVRLEPEAAPRPAEAGRAPRWDGARAS
jgi:Cu+-exporting ATPase